MEELILEQVGNMEPDEVDELSLDSWKGTIISIQDKKILEKYEALDYLSLSGCGLKSLTNFPTLPKLIKLDLNDNAITGGLENLASLKELMQLSLLNNEITSTDSFTSLSSIVTLVYLDIDGCPVCQTEDYRTKIFNLIPSLQIIDSLDREGKEASISGEDDYDDEDYDDDDDDLNDIDEDSEFDSESDEEIPKKRASKANDTLGKKK